MMQDGRLKRRNGCALLSLPPRAALSLLLSPPLSRFTRPSRSRRRTLLSSSSSANSRVEDVPPRSLSRGPRARATESRELSSRAPLRLLTLSLRHSCP